MDHWNHLQLILDSANERERALKMQIEEERQKAQALQIVISALVASIGYRGLNRSKLKTIIAQAGRETPDSGPASVRHSVLLNELNKILSQ